LECLSLAEEKSLNTISNERRRFGRMGTLFIQKNQEHHPIARAYLQLKIAHEHHCGEVVRATREDVKTLALAIHEAKQLQIKGNVIAINTIVKEVLDECNLQVARMTLTNALASVENGSPLLERGRPKIFPPNLEEVLKVRLEKRRLRIGSIRISDIYYEARALSIEESFTFHGSTTWLRSYLKKRNAKTYCSKPLEIVRSLKAQPEHGWFVLEEVCELKLTISSRCKGCSSEERNEGEIPNCEQNHEVGSTSFFFKKNKKKTLAYPLLLLG
jgi:hypothetical protein